MEKSFLNTPKTSKTGGGVTLLMVCAALLIGNCGDMPLGFGDIVDLEAPVLEILQIELSDGTIQPIADANGKLFIGPGILFGNGAMLKGRASDNIDVFQIGVVDTVTGQRWISTNVSRKPEGTLGWQYWSIALPGLQKGERTVEVTAYDYAGNIGSENVKQLTLLVDTEPPIVEKITIVRHSGIFAELMPLSYFINADQSKVVDINNFDHVDYFQNEQFTISADIAHEFTIVNVTLNFIDNATGASVFPAAIPYTSGTLYTPYWLITKDMLTAANPVYAAGKHYFKVVITAKAQAGHSGSNVITNQLYNLCWYPESDKPRIVIEGYKDEPLTHTVKSAFPMVVFDDDKMKDVYYKVILETEWNALSGATEEQKIQAAINANTNLSTFTRIQTTSRNVVVAVIVGEKPGLSRLIVIADDQNQTLTTRPSVRSTKSFKLNIVDDGKEFVDLIAVICDNPDGAYRDGKLDFKLVFGGEIYTTGAAPTITFRGGTKGDTGGPITINTNTLTIANKDVVLTASWTIPAGILFDPVTITAVNTANVRGVKQNTVPESTATEKARVAYNTNRTGLKVMSIKPDITQINGQAVTNNATVLAANGAKSQLKLTFDHAVWPENGTITVKPASGWLIPPVLSNDDFAKINNAVSSANQTALQNKSAASYYIKTTHGLSKNTSGQYTGAPDTSTKYVLNFSSNLDNALLRPILESAKYHWQEIDVSTSQITGAGTATITVDLDKLPDGRLWKVEIVGLKTADGAFRDEAGNTFAGWAPASTHTFWSQKTAEPVIRVNRVSHNSATTAPVTTVQYRIDCETPGATITYGTNTSKSAEITAAMISSTTYKASQTDTGQNSTIADATAAELASTTFINPTTSYTANATLTIGDTNIYTARKDYIAARAARTLLTQSDTGYEGAFKTLIVYRYRGNNGVSNGTVNVNNQMRYDNGTYGWLKFEASDILKGSVMTAGFPLALNDMTGKSSKYAYCNTTGNSNTVVPCDWVWISWEIVCNFYQVGMRISQNTPDSSISGQDAWQPFNDEWYVYNYRKYGNYGLKVGGQP